VFVGPCENDAYERNFRARAADLDVEDAVDLIGYLPDVARVMSTGMSVLLLPSSKEGLPGALVEAMASGLPSVVTDVGAMGTVVRAAGAGHVVRPEAGVIARAVEELWRDEHRWRRCSAAGRMYALSTFDSASVSAGYIRSLAASTLDRMGVDRAT
jgi:glycosyltransferase involved in cell wall biosynthesis